MIIEGTSYSTNFEGNIHSSKLVAVDNTFGASYLVLDQCYFDDMDRLFSRKPKPKRKKKPKCKLRTILNKKNETTRNNSRSIQG